MHASAFYSKSDRHNRAGESVERGRLQESANTVSIFFLWTKEKRKSGSCADLLVRSVKRVFSTAFGEIAKYGRFFPIAAAAVF